MTQVFSSVPRHRRPVCPDQRVGPYNEHVHSTGRTQEKRVMEPGGSHEGVDLGLEESMLLGYLMIQIGYP